MEEQAADIVIVGAGLSGLSAARRLARADRHVMLLDKGRSVGGRLATRRLAGGRADHGAQFFTVRSDEFRLTVERWLAQGLAFKWSRGWSDGSVMDTPQEGFARYAIRDGMNALARELAHGLDVWTDTRVTAIRHEAEGWAVEADNGLIVRARTLVLTPPVPQSLALLDEGAVELARGDREVLEAIHYAPCLCGLFAVDGSAVLPYPGALQRPEHPIAWIADNERKGISATRIITIHVSPEASRERWEQPDDVILGWMGEELASHLAEGATVTEVQLKRWRYALPVSLYPDPFLRAMGLPPLYFAGDAFNGPRVEGAILSGWATAAAISG